MSAETDTPDHIEASRRALLEPDVNQDLVQLLQSCRPFSGASLCFMQQTKNEWLKRIPAAQMENSYFATLSWLYIQAAPENEVRRNVWSETLFRDAVLRWTSEEVEGKPRISGEILAMAEFIIQHELKLIEDVSVKVLEKPGDKPEAAPPNS